MTARRRNESITAVPMTITSLDGAMLDTLRYRDIDEFLSLSPGVMVYRGGDGVSSRVSIRGVVSPGEWVEPGNAIYIDEIYASGMLSVLPGFYDIASVQVLKGPQAGLYGRNTMGGAALISTAQPTDEREARINASYAQYDDRQMDGMLNVPLSDQVQLRGVGWYSDKNGGYYTSGLDNHNLDASRERGGRLTLAFAPNERTDLSLTGSFDDFDGAGFTNFGGVVQGAKLGPAPLPPESRRNVLRDDLGGVHQERASVNGKLEIDTNAGTVIAVAGWRQVKLAEPDSDFDGTDYAASYAEYLANPSTATALKVRSPQALTRDDHDTLLNAEVRFLTPDSGGPLKAQVGVSYFEENARFFDQLVPLRDFALILSDIGQYGTFTKPTRQDTNSWAGFGELIWTPRDDVEITTELRYTWERKNFDFAQTPTGFYSKLYTNFGLQTSETFTNWSPGITLAYRPSDTQMVYLKYVRGFHAGGFNILVNNPALLSYDSEEAENYEVGGKAQLFNQRLEVGASIFYLRIDNALLPRPDVGPTTYYPLQNAVVAETTGMEIDLAMQAAAGFTLTASTGVYDSEVSVDDPPAFGNRAYVPDVTASLVADYQRPLTTSITGTATLGYRHRSGGRVPSLFHVEMDSYNLLDAQLGVIVNRVLIAGFVQNALNDHYMVTNFDLIFTSEQSYYVAASGLNPLTTRAIVRDPGIVFGVRAAVTF